MAIEKKSPLKARPLRNPGQSLDEEMRDIFSDKAVTYVVMVGLAIFTTLLEWFRWFRPHPPNPILITFLAALFSAFCIYKIIKIRNKLFKLQQGRDGERAVGQYLERFRTSGAIVFHDILSDDFNIDHVIVSEQGVFVIETKTYSKPKRGGAVIDYTGDILQFNGGVKNGDIIIQAKAAASWLAELIHESTGKKVFVRPVVVFPGWYIQKAASVKDPLVWVLNPKSLEAFVSNSHQRLSREDGHLVAYHLSRYIRTFERKA